MPTAYAKWPGAPTIPCCEVMFTIRPRASPRSGWVSICRTAARQSRNGPRRLTAIIASPVVVLGLEQRLRVARRRAPRCSRARPARPHRSTARATSASQSAREDTSAATYSASPPAAAISASVGSPPVRGSRRTSATRTRNPSVASRCATARPMPDAPPVTIAERVTAANIHDPWAGSPRLLTRTRRATGAVMPRRALPGHDHPGLRRRAFRRSSRAAGAPAALRASSADCAASAASCAASVRSYRSCRRRCGARCSATRRTSAYAVVSASWSATRCTDRSPRPRRSPWNKREAPRPSRPRRRRR